MYLVRDVFNCKPGKANELIERFKKSMALLGEAGGAGSIRFLVDYIATYWTVVLEAEVNDLGEFEKHMQEWRSRDDVRGIMEGYMDLVEGGHREIFRIV